MTRLLHAWRWAALVILALSPGLQGGAIAQDPSEETAFDDEDRPSRFEGLWLPTRVLDEALAMELSLLDDIGYFRDARGNWQLFTPAYDAMRRREGLESNLPRALFEQLFLLSAGNGWYWSNLLVNSKDWDFPPWEDRFVTGKAIRFDNNSFLLNNWGHPLAGAAFYAFARANDLNIAASFGLAAMSSSVWEFFSEFREKVSINDSLFTPIGGVSAGEFWYQLGRYLCSAPLEGRPAHQVAAFLLASTSCLHDVLDGGLPRRAPPRVDHLGLDADVWHAFTLDTFAGGTLEHADLDARGRAPVMGFGFSGELAALPGYLRPGRFHTRITNGNFSRLAFEATYTDQALRQLHLSSEARLLGYYQQDIRAEGASRFGYALDVGLSTALDIVEFQDGDFIDRRARLHMAGASTRIHVFAEPFRFDARLAGWLDLGAVDSLAWEDWRARFPEVVTKSVLIRQGYHFLLGPTLELDLTLALDALSLTASAEWSHHTSIQGLDREQSSVEEDTVGHEDIVLWSAALRYQLFHPWTLVASARARGFYRLSRLGDVEASASHVELLGGLSFLF